MLETRDLSNLVWRTLDQEVRPYLQSHGGDVELVSISNGSGGVGLTVKLLGACRHCELRTVTFAATVRSKLLALAEVESVACEGVTVSAAKLESIARFFR